MHKGNVIMGWRRTSKGNVIRGSKCAECHALFFPERTACRKCGPGKMEDYVFKGTGKVHSYSVVHYPLTGFEWQVPYTVAIIELDEGPRITAQVVECAKVERGMRVDSCVRRVYVDGEQGVIQYGIKFRPAD